ncbi:MAG: alkane 1-monooxygenase [Alphaproteobacteria bacterium]|nr:alkane 1-monooxygenase [Alphaproteobacteria bacterium]
MRYPIAYAISIAIALCLVIGHYVGGIGHFAMPLLGFAFMPIADRWAGLSHWPSESALKKMNPAKERAFEAALIGAAFVTLVTLAWGLWVAAHETLMWWQFAGLAVSIGMLTGYVGIVVAHELMHRASLMHRALAWVLMSVTIYPHFCIEHIHGHHPRFATPDDHATARRGESFYLFLPRTIFGGLASALRIKPAPVLVAYTVILVLGMAIYRWLGTSALTLLLIQAAVAILLLEGINYLEHYGLLRARRASGHYEPAGPGHSWDTSYYLTNINIFNLGRHTDHHSHARRPYYRLRHIEEAPQLPYGYATMFLIALMPPLWFYIMNRRLDTWQANALRRHSGQNEVMHFSKKA